MTAFRIINEKLEQTVTHLLSINFLELKPAIDEQIPEPLQILINRKNKTFYYLDSESISHATRIIEEFLKQEIKPITYKKLKKWEN